MDSVATNLRDRALKICCEHLGGAWKKISVDQISVTPISGGMTNQLYCCSLPESFNLPEGEPNQALLRLYGDQWRDCDMSLQVKIFELLSERELGPKLYGKFDDGRLEEFLPAQSLTSAEMCDPKISQIIARKLARVHSLDVPNMNKNENWLLERFREWLEFINNHRRSPSDYSDGVAHSTLKIANKLLAIDFEHEINFVRKIIDDIKSPIVFSHNDLHQGNILLAKPTKRRSILDKRVILIDFEYCSYNYRAYDIANHFCEWCFEYDTPEYPHSATFEERFPSVEVQRKFIRDYLGDEPDEAEVNKILNEIKPFCMTAHLVWALWSIKCAYLPTTKFGYWEHAWSRWQLYSNLKLEFMQKSHQDDRLTNGGSHSIPSA